MRNTRIRYLVAAPQATGIRENVSPRRPTSHAESRHKTRFYLRRRLLARHA